MQLKDSVEIITGSLFLPTPPPFQFSLHIAPLHLILSGNISSLN